MTSKPELRGKGMLLDTPPPPAEPSLDAMRVEMLQGALNEEKDRRIAHLEAVVADKDAEIARLRPARRPRPDGRGTAHCRRPRRRRHDRRVRRIAAANPAPSHTAAGRASPPGTADMGGPSAHQPARSTGIFGRLVIGYGPKLTAYAGDAPRGRAGGWTRRVERSSPERLRRLSA
jgi:hypothetical protein